MSAQVSRRRAWLCLNVNTSAAGLSLRLGCLLKAIEQAAGLSSAAGRLPTTVRSVAYRFISTLLRLQLNDRHTWDVRNESPDSSDWDAQELRGFLPLFSRAVEAARSAPSNGLHHEPESHFWAVLRDGIPVGIVSIEGFF